jgi:cyanate permease
VQVKEDGSLEWTGVIELEQGMDEAAKGGAVLVAQLLGLLFTFIGQSLTLRLVRDLWPDAPFEDMNSKMEKQL